MKAIIVSDTHKERGTIEDIVKFAKKEQIKTVFDAGDLHGEISAYNGIENLHAVYWEKASGAMDKWDFMSAIRGVGGTFYENGSAFKFEDVLVFLQHNLADYEDEIPEQKAEMANARLDSLAEQYSEEKDLKQIVLFGHTHNQHFVKEDKSVFINPGWGAEGCFAVVDTDEDSVEYFQFVPGKQEPKSLIKIDKNSDIKHFRKFDLGRYIAGLKNGKEVFVYKKDGKEVRTEEFQKIIYGISTDKGLDLKIVNNDGLQQLIKGEFRSKAYKKIGKSFEEYDDEQGASTGRFSGYVATIEADGKDKQVLVVGQDEVESIAFDEIVTYPIPIIKQGITMFVGQTKIKDDDDKEKTISHLVWKDKIIAEYKSIDDLIHEQERMFITAQDQSDKCFVAEIGPRGGVHTGKKYDSVSDVKVMQGHLVYIAKSKEKMFVVVDGQEQAKYDSQGWRDKISKVQFIGGKLCYVLEQEEGHRLVFDGKESEPVESGGFDTGIEAVQEIDGMPAYLAKSKSEDDRIIRDGKTVLQKESIDGFVCIDGKIAYTPKKWGDECFWEDGTQIKGYKNIHTLQRDFEKGKFKPV